MRILLAHNAYARPSGEEHAVSAIGELLSRKGHEVERFTRSSSELTGSPLRTARAFFTGIHSPGARRAMAGVLDRFEPDVVQVQNLYPLLSPSILAACRDRGVPVVMRCPNYRLLCPTGLHYSAGAVCEKCLTFGRESWCVVRNCAGSLPRSIGYALRSSVARMTGSITGNVSVFLVLSAFQKHRFAQAGIPEERLHVVPNICPVVGPGAEPGTGTGVAYFARLSAEKGIGDLIELARANPDLPVAVAGQVRDRATERLVQEAPANIRFHGHLTGEALDAFVAAARVVVCCSRWFEGFPNTITRAMAAGKPVIAPRLGGIPEIVADGVTGLLYRAGDAADLAVKARALCDDAARCASMGRAGRERARSEYGSERVYGELLAAYDRAARLNRSSCAAPA